MTNPVRILVVGLGNMGRSHALAYHRLDGFEIVGLTSRTIRSTAHRLPAQLHGYPLFEDYDQALLETQPDAVSINTYTDSHAAYAIRAMHAGCHVFVEKPLATSVADAEAVVAKAKATRRKLVLGYILRVHPAWQKLIEIGRGLGKPLVMRMNLNQQSSGPAWAVHRQLMESTTPIVDCGVHYVDVMCQITDARPVEVRGMGVRLSDEIAPDMYNYGALQVLFEDGSRGWYEAAWGPMVSENAFFIKDVMTPNGAVSIVMDPGARSDDLDTHTRTDQIRVHRAALTTDGSFANADEYISMQGEPHHDALCAREQDYVYRAIVEDIDLSRHMNDAVQSLRICLAADESIRSGLAVQL